MPEQLDQTERFIKLATPLGENVLLVRSYTGREELSRLFQFQLDLVSTSASIAASEILGKNVTLGVRLSDEESWRYINGIVSRFGILPAEDQLYCYRMEVVPWLWYLTRTSDCRIFQEKSVVDIIEQIFGEYGFGDYLVGDIRGTHDKRDYCVQYRETDFNFISRLMEEEGIYYYFKHEDGKHTLVLTDDKSTHKPLEYLPEVSFEHGSGAGTLHQEDTIRLWERHYSFQPGKYSQTDYNFETPSTSLLSTSPSVIQVPGNQKFELFDYPGEYSNRAAGERLTTLRMEEREAAYDVVQGESDCRAFAPGFKFTLRDHPDDSQNASYILTSVSHRASQGSFVGGEMNAPVYYLNSFTCIPDKVKYRPARSTPKPLVQGSQTAVVVGPPGEEIYTDQYGRVKVQFHWDREGAKDDRSSFWIRVAQPWAGTNYGMMFIPRVGQEVIVDFLEGDPDRPIITGRVYNAEQMPPYDLPANKTRSTIKTRSSAKGSASNFNEIRFEDKKGSEQLFIHAEKDLDLRVKEMTREWIGASRHMIVKEGLFEHIHQDAHLKVGQSMVQEVGGDIYLKLNGSQHSKIGSKQAVDAGQEIHLKAGMNVVIEGGIGVTLKGPGGFVAINPAGVTIQGTIVLINSGGSAASGGGVQSKAVTAPEEADDGSGSSTKGGKGGGQAAKSAAPGGGPSGAGSKIGGGGGGAAPGPGGSGKSAAGTQPAKGGPFAPGVGKGKDQEGLKGPAGGGLPGGAQMPGKGGLPGGAQMPGKGGLPGGTSGPGMPGKEGTQGGAMSGFPDPGKTGGGMPFK